MKIPIKISLFVAVCALVLNYSPVTQAQSLKLVKCGDIISGEFPQRPKNEQLEEKFNINLSPGDMLHVSAKGVGDYLPILIFILDPSGAFLNLNGREPDVTTGVLSARGTYIIRVLATSGGEYTLSIGCTLRDGTLIQPGSAAQPTSIQTPSAVITMQPTPPPGLVFPGLTTPIDFSKVSKIPLQPGINNGAITPTGGEILGFAFNANVNALVELSFTRVSGNLNLGLVVLSADNKVAFQASLVTSDTLSTHFRLPATGQYTVSVFRIDLLPPANPDATAFQIQAKLNS